MLHVHVHVHAHAPCGAAHAPCGAAPVRDDPLVLLALPRLVLAVPLVGAEAVSPPRLALFSRRRQRRGRHQRQDRGRRARIGDSKPRPHALGVGQRKGLEAA